LISRKTRGVSFLTRLWGADPFPRQESRGSLGSNESGLSPDTELFNEPFIAIEVLRMQIIEQSAPFAYEPQKPEARMVVFRVRLQMLGQLLNPSSEYRNLDFGRAAVSRSPGVALDNFPLAGGLEGHQANSSFPFPLFNRQPYQTRHG
jgi:hypothetical protein